jgi:hypothetical protein
MKKCTTSCGCSISSIRHLTHAEIGKLISCKLAKIILIKNNLAEPKLSELLTMMRILKQLKWRSTDLESEAEYTAVIEYYQQITGKPTTVELSELKWSIDLIGASVVCLKSTFCTSNKSAVSIVR